MELGIIFWLMRSTNDENGNMLYYAYVWDCYYYYFGMILVQAKIIMRASLLRAGFVDDGGCATSRLCFGDGQNWNNLKNKKNSH